MKQFSNIITLIVIVACLTSCNLRNKKDDIFTSGKWYINDYNISGKEKKSLYAGFSFTFSQDNHIIATKNNHSYIGDWSILKGDITDDAPPVDLDLIIQFNTRDDLSNLNGKWMIRDRTFSTLRLSNDENYLIFEKS